jgi:hypothetical protein
MNAEQVKGSIRWFVATFGGAIAGFVAGKGWVSADTVMQALSSEVFISAAASIAVGIWGLFVHTQQNAVAVVGAIAADPTSAVKGVVTSNTPEGVALANSVAGTTVVPAGSTQATEIAKPGT